MALFPSNRHRSPAATVCAPPGQNHEGHKTCILYILYVYMYVRRQQQHGTCTTYILNTLYVYMYALVIASFPVVSASVAGSNGVRSARAESRGSYSLYTIYTVCLYVRTQATTTLHMYNSYTKYTVCLYVRTGDSFVSSRLGVCRRQQRCALRPGRITRVIQLVYYIYCMSICTYAGNNNITYVQLIY